MAGVINPNSVQPFTDLSAEDLKVLWRDNAEGVRFLTYGDRDPRGQGYDTGHDHGPRGGVHVGMALERLSFGPYETARFDLDPGLPLCPPDPDEDISFDSGTAKLIAPACVRIVGGVTAVHIDTLLLPELGGASPQAIVIGVVLRPLGFVNKNSFNGEVNAAAFQYGHMQKISVSLSGAVPTKHRVTFSSLSQLGNPRNTRMAELCYFLCSDLGADNIIHLLSACVLVSAVTNDVAPNQPSYPSSGEVPPSTILEGQPLLEGVGLDAKKRGNRLSRAVLGGEPGFVGEELSPGRAFVQELYGAHQHEGSQIPQEDGTVISDGALWSYSLFSQCYAQLDENGSDEFPTSDPCTGLEVSRSGVLDEECTFFQSIPLARGAMALRFTFALRPETSSPITRLALAVHLCRENVAPTSANNLIASVAGTGAVDATGFRIGTVQPTETLGYQHSGERPGLGLWTRDAEQAETFLPDGVNGQNLYRVSEEVNLQLVPGVRQTESYVLRYRFLLYSDQTEAALDDEASLLWAHAYAVE